MTEKEFELLKNLEYYGILCLKDDHAEGSL